VSRRTKLAAAVLALALVGLIALSRRKGEVPGGAAPPPGSSPHATGAEGRSGSGKTPEASSGLAGAGPARSGQGQRPLPRFVGRAATADSPGGAAEPTGEMSPADVRAGVVQAMPAVKACYEKQLQKDSRLSGRMVVQFTIVEREGAGRISSATIVPDQGDAGHELISPATEHCVLTALAETRFTAPVGGPVEVSFPFVFSASDEGESPRR
jgi:hypothetical protein